MSNLSLKSLLEALDKAGLSYSRPWLDKKIKRGDISLPKRSWNDRYDLTPEIIDTAVESIKKTGKYVYKK